MSNLYPEMTDGIKNFQEKILVDKAVALIERTYRYFLGFVDHYVPGSNAYIYLEKEVVNNDGKKDVKLVLKIVLYPLSKEKIRSITVKGL